RSEQEIDRVGPRERIQRGERFCPAERAEHVCDRERARRETDEDRGGAERPSLPRRLTEGGYRDFPLLVGERGPQRLCFHAERVDPCSARRARCEMLRETRRLGGGQRLVDVHRPLELFGTGHLDSPSQGSSIFRRSACFARRISTPTWLRVMPSADAISS